MGYDSPCLCLIVLKLHMIMSSWYYLYCIIHKLPIFICQLQFFTLRVHTVYWWLKLWNSVYTVPSVRFHINTSIQTGLSLVVSPGNTRIAHFVLYWKTVFSGVRKTPGRANSMGLTQLRWKTLSAKTISLSNKRSHNEPYVFLCV